jgi:hypothetical protein
MSNSNYGIGVVTGLIPVIPVILVLGYSYFTGAPVEVGNIKIGALSEIDSPAMKRCKTVQAFAGNYGQIFAETKNALDSAIRDIQEKEAELIKLWIEVQERQPDNSFAINGVASDISIFRKRYHVLQNEVKQKLDYIGKLINYILQGCGLGN